MKLKTDDYVRITKTNTQTPGNLSDGYWAEGVLARNIEAGRPVKIWRLRNSVNPNGRFGIFETSVVQHIVGDLIETKNSTYRIEKAIVPPEFKNRKTI